MTWYHKCKLLFDAKLALIRSILWELNWSLSVKAPSKYWGEKCSRSDPDSAHLHFIYGPPFYQIIH